jgi:hypothetical protein
MKKIYVLAFDVYDAVSFAKKCGFKKEEVYVVSFANSLCGISDVILLLVEGYQNRPDYLEIRNMIKQRNLTCVKSITLEEV